MKPGARVAAAIDILDDVLNRHQPVTTALTSWGKAHRFAGSGDRSAIGTLVYDSLRHKASSAFVMGSDTPRALILGSLRQGGADVSALRDLCSGGGHDVAAFSPEENERLEKPSLEGAPMWVRGDYPEWLNASFERAFGVQAADEGSALAARASVDVRANTLKADRDKVLKALAGYGPLASELAPHGISVPAPVGGAKQPHLETETAHGKGWFEIQDTGSQIAAALSGAAPRMQVLDLCAGAGGKTLAMAAAMQNTGQIYAYDTDKHQLRPIFERLKRAGARNVQVLNAGDTAALEALGARFDVVIADAPCTGSGTWRRRPDAKWRLKPDALATRLDDQRAVLSRAALSVRPGGRLLYVTCSLLPEENGDQVAQFLNENPNFNIEPYGSTWRAAIGTEPPASADGQSGSLLLTPARHGTDGFFIAALKREF